jgi:hypothetical protein
VTPFTFTNAAMLHTRNNPGFFKSTVVEQAVADELRAGKSIARCDGTGDFAMRRCQPWKGNTTTGDQ